VTGSWHQTTT